MNGGLGIEKRCLLVFFVIGARAAIVNVLTVLETQNLEPNRTILLFTHGSSMAEAISMETASAARC
jgi:hypothetical protein